MDSATLSSWRQRILASFTRLNDRDTARSAIDQLTHDIDELTEETLPAFMAILFETVSSRGAAICKEALRLLAITAAYHKDALTPYIPKIVSALVKRLRDTEVGVGVRETCAEALGIIARFVPPPADLVQAPDATMTATMGAAASDHVLGVYFKPLFTLFSDQDRAVQTGAGQCIAAVIESSRPDLVIADMPRLAQRLVSRLSLPTTHAHSSLLLAMSKLVEVTGDASIPHVPALVAAALLQAKSTDWLSRKSAAEFLTVCAVKLGPAMTPLRDEILQVLSSGKFDKVPPVREAVAIAIKCYQDLMEALRSRGGSVPTTQVSPQPSFSATTTGSRPQSSQARPTSAANIKPMPTMSATAVLPSMASMGQGAVPRTGSASAVPGGKYASKRPGLSSTVTSGALRAQLQTAPSSAECEIFMPKNPPRPKTGGAEGGKNYPLMLQTQQAQQDQPGHFLQGSIPDEELGGDPPITQDDYAEQDDDRQMEDIEEEAEEPEPMPQSHPAVQDAIRRRSVSTSGTKQNTPDEERKGVVVEECLVLLERQRNEQESQRRHREGMEDRVRRLELALERISRQAEGSRAATEEADSQVSGLRSEFDRVQDDLDRVMKERETEREHASKVIALLEERNAEGKRSQEEMQVKLVELQSRIESQRAQHLREMKQLSESMATSVRGQLQGWVAEQEEEGGALGDTRRATQDLSDSFQELRSLLESVQTRTEQVAAQQGQLGERLRVLIAEGDESLRQSQLQIRQQIQVTEEKAEKLRRQFEDLSRRSLEQGEAIARAQRDSADHIKEAESRLESSLREQAEATQASMDETRGEIQEAIERVSALEEQAARASEGISDARQAASEAARTSKMLIEEAEKRWVSGGSQLERRLIQAEAKIVEAASRDEELARAQKRYEEGFMQRESRMQQEIAAGQRSKERMDTLERALGQIQQALGEAEKRRAELEKTSLMLPGDVQARVMEAVRQQLVKSEQSTREALRRADESHLGWQATIEELVKRLETEQTRAATQAGAALKASESTQKSLVELQGQASKSSEESSQSAQSARRRLANLEASMRSMAADVALSVARLDRVCEAQEQMMGGNRQLTAQEIIATPRTLWEQALAMTSVGHVDGAFKGVLSARDSMVLLRLMELTGPSLDKLDDATRGELFRQIIPLMSSGKSTGIILPWVEQHVELEALPPSHISSLASALAEVAGSSSSPPEVAARASRIQREIRNKWTQFLAPGTLPPPSPIRSPPLSVVSVGSNSSTGSRPRSTGNK